MREKKAHFVSVTSHQIENPLMICERIALKHIELLCIAATFRSKRMCFMKRVSSSCASLCKPVDFQTKQTNYMNPVFLTVALLPFEKKLTEIF